MPDERFSDVSRHRDALLACVAAFERHAQELEQAEAALREHEATITALFANAPQGIITVDETGRIVQANAMAATLFGYEELVGKQVDDLLPEKLRTRHTEHRENYFAAPRARPMGLGIELAGKRQDGSTFPVEISLSHVTTKDGMLAVAFVSDITKRKRAEATVSALLESASQAIIGVNSTGTVVMVNAMTEQLFGHSREELVGQSIELLLPDRVRERHVAHRSGYFREPRTRPMGIGMDLSARRKDGSEFPVEISLSHVTTEHGVLAVAFVTDITERKRAEEALMQQAQELARSNADLQQFAYSTSHDLQEPLRMISSYAQLLAARYRGQLDEAAEQYIAYMVEGVHRLEALINDLLAFSRVANSPPTDGDPVPLNAVIEWAMKNLEVTIAEAGATITHDDLPVISGNQIQLVQVFQNILSNSIKYRQTDRTPQVHVGFTERDGECLISVRDNGVGISPEYHERIFGLFKRLSRETPGTGVGLAISKKIVEKHGGRIWVKSAPGEGSTFYIALPADRAPCSTMP